jgi:hypothetical protein
MVRTLQMKGTCCHSRVSLFVQVGLACSPPVLHFLQFAEMIGADYHTQIFVEMGSQNFFSGGWPGNAVLWISTPQVARIIGVSHQHLGSSLVLKDNTLSPFQLSSKILLCYGLDPKCPLKAYVLKAWSPACGAIGRYNL